MAAYGVSHKAERYALITSTVLGTVLEVIIEWALEQVPGGRNKVLILD
jgi:hypothetical protein